MDRFSRKKQRLVLLASLATLSLVSYLDYLTGYQLLFYVFYFIPVALCGWFLRRRMTLILAGLCGISWWIVDKLSGQQYPHEGYRAWNAVICFVAFATIGVVLNRLRATLAEQQRDKDRLRKTLDDLRKSTEEIRKLQEDLQVVCSWTKRILVNGKWVAIDQFLADKLNFSITHRLSPEALDEIRKALENEQVSPAPDPEARRT
jgi:hypothetical protein